MFGVITGHGVHLKDPTEFALYEVFESKGLERSLGATDFLADSLSKVECFAACQLVFKKKVRLDPTILSQDPAEDRLEFFQIHMEIVQGKLPSSFVDAMCLAAIRLYIQYKETLDLSNTQHLQELISRYLPASLVKNSQSADLIKALTTEYKQLLNRKPAQLEEELLIKEYMTRAKKLPLFGRTLFAVEHVDSDWDLPPRFYLGISAYGIEFIQPDTYKIFLTYTFGQVKSKMFTPNMFTITFRMTVSGTERERTLDMTTFEGVEISSVIDSYIHFLLQDSTQAKALIDYDVEGQERLLPFKKGDVIDILKKGDNGWWTGTCNGKKGMFPEDAVEPILTPIVAAPGAPPRKSSRAPLPELKPRNPESIDAGGVSKPTRARGTTLNIQSAQFFTKVDVNAFSAHIVGEEVSSGRQDISLEHFVVNHFRKIVSGGDSDKLSAGVLSPKLTIRKTKRKSGLPSLNTESATDLISHTLQPIKEPLLSTLPAQLSKQGVDAFLCVMKYMGDYPVKKKRHLEHLQSFAQLGIDEPKLRDELYTYLIKQTNNNNTAESLVRGWEMLSIICGLFLPSRLLVYYLVSYIQQNAREDTSQENLTSEEEVQRDVGRLATVSIMRLNRLKAVGMRKVAPSALEHSFIRKAEPIKVDVWKLDGTFIQVEIDMAFTALELNKLVMQELKLAPESIAGRDWGIHAFLADTSQAQRRFNGEMGQRLPDSKSICDVLGDWERKGVKGKLVFHESFSSDPFQVLSDPVGVYLLYHQAVSQVLYGRVALSEGEAAYLAALQFHIEVCNGEDIPDAWTKFKAEEKCLQYLPDCAALRVRKPDSLWVASIYDEWKRFDKSLNTFNAQVSYLETIWRWRFYGSRVFFAESKQEKHQLMNAILINWQGVHAFALPQKEPLASYPFASIPNWNAPRADTLSMMVGSLMNPALFLFSTRQHAQLVVESLESYVKKIVAERQAQAKLKMEQELEQRRYRARGARPF